MIHEPCREEFVVFSSEILQLGVLLILVYQFVLVCQTVFSSSLWGLSAVKQSFSSLLLFSVSFK